MINFETCKIWKNHKSEPIGSKERFDDLFPKYQVNGFARFKDINNDAGWVNEQGDQIGTLHDATYDFKENHAQFYDVISDFEEKWGCVNYLGIELYADLKTCEKLLELVLKDFPENSMKLYLLRKFL